MSVNGPDSQQKPNYTMSYLPDFVKGFALPKEESRAMFEKFPLDKKRQFSAFVKEVFAIAKSKEISNNDAMAIIGHREAYLTEIQRLEEENKRLLAENEARLVYYSSRFAERLSGISSPASAPAVAPISSQRPQPTHVRSKPQASNAEVNALSDGLSNLALNRNSSISSASAVTAASPVTSHQSQRVSSASAAVTISAASALSRISKPPAPAVKLQLPPLPSASPLKPKAPAAKPPANLASAAASAAVSPTVANTATDIVMVEPPPRTFLVKAPAKASSKRAAASARALPATPATCHAMMATQLSNASAITVPGADRNGLRPK